MPELPEAEVVRRQLHAAVVGTTIKHIRVGRKDIIRQGVESLSWYSGSRITEVQRHGKSVALICERGAEERVVAAELGMTGLLLFTREAIPSAKHV
ncbi:MAG: DNA-formamidopyrimidine glycosylase, partial [Nitrospira sp. SB0672_bin_25]|nr:DNA-formamidopyrimidine glycosylase [Nitrospira sp. SB0672_bin_25]